MHKKYMVLVLIPALLIQLYGCYSMQEISKDEMVGMQDGDDLIVQRKIQLFIFLKNPITISQPIQYLEKDMLNLVTTTDSKKEMIILYRYQILNPCNKMN